MNIDKRLDSLYLSEEGELVVSVTRENESFVEVYNVLESEGKIGQVAVTSKGVCRVCFNKSTGESH